MDKLPYVAFKKISEYLDDESCVNLSTVCTQMGFDFHITQLTIYTAIHAEYYYHNRWDKSLIITNYNYRILEKLFTICPHIKTLTIRNLYRDYNIYDNKYVLIEKLILPQCGYFLTKLEIHNTQPTRTVTLHDFPLLNTLILELSCKFLTIKETPLLETLNVKLSNLFNNNRCTLLGDNKLSEVKFFNVFKINNNFKLVIQQLRILHIANDALRNTRYIMSNQHISLNDAHNLVELYFLNESDTIYLPSKLLNLTRLRLHCNKIEIIDNFYCYMPKLIWLHVNLYPWIHNDIIRLLTSETSFNLEIEFNKNNTYNRVTDCQLQTYQISNIHIQSYCQIDNDSFKKFVQHCTTVNVKYSTWYDLNYFPDNDVIIDKLYVNKENMRKINDISLRRVRVRKLYVTSLVSHKKYAFTMKNKNKTPSHIIQRNDTIQQLEVFDTLCVCVEAHKNIDLPLLNNINLSNVKYLILYDSEFIPDNLISLLEITIYIPINSRVVNDLKRDINLKYPKCLIKYKIVEHNIHREYLSGLDY